LQGEDFALEHKLKILNKKKVMTTHMLERIVCLPNDQLLVELQLSSIDQSCTKNITAWTVRNLAKHTLVVDWSKQKEQFEHLKDIEFPEMPEDLTIKIIMGVDNTAFFSPVETIQNPDNETDPTAIKLSLGWTLCRKKQPITQPTNIVFPPKN
jgi:hypothetical protein